MSVLFKEVVMNKIYAYILRGSGVGAFLLFAMAFLASLYYMYPVRSVLVDSIPYMQDVADQLLPVKIENGRIVEPVDTYREVKLFADDDLNDDASNDMSPFSYRLVLDTRADELDAYHFSDGIYVSRQYIYMVANKNVERQSLEGTYEIEKKDYSDVFEDIVQWASWGYFFILLLSVFMGYFVLTIILSFLSALALHIYGRSLSFDVKMRMTSVIFVAVQILYILLTSCGISMTWWLWSCLLVIFGQILLVKKLPA